MRVMYVATCHENRIKLFQSATNFATASFVVVKERHGIDDSLLIDASSLGGGVSQKELI